MDKPQKLTTRRKQSKQIHNTICAAHHYAQINTCILSSVRPVHIVLYVFKVFVLPSVWSARVICLPCRLFSLCSKYHVLSTSVWLFCPVLFSYCIVCPSLILTTPLVSSNISCYKCNGAIVCNMLYLMQT